MFEQVLEMMGIDMPRRYGDLRGRLGKSPMLWTSKMADDLIIQKSPYGKKSRLNGIFQHEETHRALKATIQQLRDHP